MSIVGIKTFYLALVVGVIAIPPKANVAIWMGRGEIALSRSLPRAKSEGLLAMTIVIEKNRK